MAVVILEGAVGRRKAITYEVDERGCHICTSHRPNTHGYPQLWANGGNNNMHRVLYIEAFGELPPEIVVRHTCDVRLCINLEHMVPGTHAENDNDKNERGRRNTAKGENAGGAKLSLAKVVSIREREGTQRALGEEFGVSQSQISRIKSGKRWGEGCDEEVVQR